MWERLSVSYLGRRTCSIRLASLVLIVGLVDALGPRNSKVHASTLPSGSLLQHETGDTFWPFTSDDDGSKSGSDNPSPKEVVRKMQSAAQPHNKIISSSRTDAKMRKQAARVKNTGRKGGAVQDDSFIEEREKRKKRGSRLKDPGLLNKVDAKHGSLKDMWGTLKEVDKADMKKAAQLDEEIKAIIATRKVEGEKVKQKRLAVHALQQQMNLLTKKKQMVDEKKKEIKNSYYEASSVTKAVKKCIEDNKETLTCKSVEWAGDAGDAELQAQDNEEDLDGEDTSQDTGDETDAQDVSSEDVPVVSRDNLDVQDGDKVTISRDGQSTEVVVSSKETTETIDKAATLEKETPATIDKATTLEKAPEHIDNSTEAHVEIPASKAKVEEAPKRLDATEGDKEDEGDEGVTAADFVEDVKKGNKAEELHIAEFSWSDDVKDMLESTDLDAAKIAAIQKMFDDASTTQMALEADKKGASAHLAWGPVKECAKDQMDCVDVKAPGGGEADVTCKVGTTETETAETGVRDTETSAEFTDAEVHAEDIRTGTETATTGAATIKAASSEPAKATLTVTTVDVMGDLYASKKAFGFVTEAGEAFFASAKFADAQKCEFPKKWDVDECGVKVKVVFAAGGTHEGSVRIYAASANLEDNMCVQDEKGSAQLSCGTWVNVDDEDKGDKLEWHEGDKITLAE